MAWASCALFLHIFSIITLLVNPSAYGAEREYAELKALAAVYEAEHLHIFLLLDQIPAHTLQREDRRLTLRLESTRTSDALSPLPLDDKLLRATIQQKGQDALLSLFFPYPPQKVAVTRMADDKLLLLDILPGNQFTALYPALSDRMRELPLKPKGLPPAPNPLSASHYHADWPSFFTRYEPQVQIQVAPRLLLPPFPLAALIAPNGQDAPWLPMEAQQAAAQGDWQQVSKQLAPGLDQFFPLARKQTEKREICADPRPLTFAEALLREGKNAQARWLLQRLRLHCSGTQTDPLARLLLLHVEFRQGDIYSAALGLPLLREQLREQMSGQPTAKVLDPYLRMMLAELALLTGQPDAAAAWLDGDFAIKDPVLQQTALLRQADLFFAQDDQEQALALYQELAQKQKKDSPLAQDAAALARFAELLGRQDRYTESAQVYGRLVALLTDTDQQEMGNLALFCQIMAKLKADGNLKEAEAALAALARDAGQDDATPADGQEQPPPFPIPTQEGPARALLKLIDLRYLRGAILPETATRRYGEIAARAPWSAIREEAGFKQALVSALNGWHEESVAQCMALLRGFQTGTLRGETMALLLSQLPELLKRLVADRRYVEALALASRNRYFFAHGWIGPETMPALARAYQELGLAGRSTAAWRYLYNISKEARLPALYPPLIDSLLAEGDAGQAELFADLYLFRYPQGNERPLVFTRKAKILHAQGRHQELLHLLEQANAPDSPWLRFLRGQALFALQQWEQALAIFTQEELRDLVRQHPLLPAEASFHSRRLSQASTLFQEMARTGPEQDLARFRLAQIAVMENRSDQASQLFDSLATTGKDPLWRRLAHEEAALLRMRQKQDTGDNRN